MDSITCAVCLQMYDESDKCPRVLTCGHTFCHSCMVQLFDIHTESCPYCKTEIEFFDAETVPINFSLKNVLSLTSEEELKFGIKKLVTEKYSLGQDHITEFLHRSPSAEEAIHREMKERIEQSLFNEMKNQTIQNLEAKLEERLIVKEGLNELIEEIERVEHFATPRDLAKRLVEMMSLRSEANEFCENLKKFLASVENAASFSDLLKAKQDHHYSLLEIGKILNPGEVISMKDLESKCKKESVYVQEDRYGKPKYGKVAVKDGRIRIFDFKSEKPDAIIVPFKELLIKFNKSTKFPKTVFLQLAPAFKVSEDKEVMIITDGITQRSHNFALLCSGILGPSYIGYSMYSSLEFDSRMIKEGPTPVVRCIGPSKRWSQNRVGCVYGMEPGDSWFCVSLNPLCTTSTSLAMFGIVISGLRNLQELEGVYFVQKCGLVI